MLEWESDDELPSPFINTRTLDSVRLVEDALVGKHGYLTSEVAPRILIEDSEAYPKRPQVPVAGLKLLNEQLLRDAETLEFNSALCPITAPDLGSYISGLDLFIVGSSSTCEFNAHHLYVALQPSTRTMFRLHGNLPTLTRSEVVEFMLSGIPAPDENRRSVLDLSMLIDDQNVARDIFNVINVAPDTLEITGVLDSSLTFGRVQRLAVRLSPGQSIAPYAQGHSVEMWALTDGSELSESTGGAITIGRFSFYDVDDMAVVTNYINKELIVVLEIQWDDDALPSLDIVWSGNDDDEEEFSYADWMFQSFDDVTRTTFEAIGPEDYQEVEASLLESGQLPDGASFTMFDRELLLADSSRSFFGSIEDDAFFNLVQMGDLVLPVPSNLKVTTASLNQTTYAVRANPFGLRARFFDQSNYREVVIRNSAAVLPGTSEIPTSALQSVDTSCRTYREAERSLGGTSLYMTLEGNCFDGGIGNFPASNDRARSVFALVRLRLVEGSYRDLPYDDNGTASEILSIDVRLGFSEDADYVVQLVDTLSYYFSGLSAPEARALIGQPDYDEAFFNSDREPFSP